MGRFGAHWREVAELVNRRFPGADAPLAPLPSMPVEEQIEALQAMEARLGARRIVTHETVTAPWTPVRYDGGEPSGGPTT